jgi:hypothetical protein
MIDPSQVLPEFRPLLAEDRLNELGPGSPNIDMRAQLEQLERELRTSTKVRNRDFAKACMAGLWLYHDFLDESHSLSQELHTVEGSYWHAIMHRREPDFGNSKYWFHRVPKHPIFDDLCRQARALTEQASTPKGSEFLVQQKVWSPSAFVDLCEQAAHGPSELQLLSRQVQRCEWDLLFLFCQLHAEFQEIS